MVEYPDPRIALAQGSGLRPDHGSGRISSHVAEHPYTPDGPKGPSNLDLMLEGVSSIQDIADAAVQRLDQMHCRAFGSSLSCLSVPASSPQGPSATAVSMGRVNELKQRLGRLESTLKLVGQCVIEMEGMV